MSPLTLLKTDVFGTITCSGNTVIRDARAARPWARWLALRLMRREHRALTRLALKQGIDGIPRVLDFSPGILTRSWIDGAPMQIARPCDPAYFRAASKLIRRVHAANVIHNDLAKETNWLVTPDGHPALVDFQLAMTQPPNRFWSRIEVVVTAPVPGDDASATSLQRIVAGLRGEWQ